MHNPTVSKFNADLIVLSYHQFVDQHSEYRFSRTYDQFGHDISKKAYDWITIDDGMVCMVRACDMLRYCNIRAKLFICTSLVGQKGYCTWPQIKELSKYHDIENHGHVHEYHDKMVFGDAFDSIHHAQDLIYQNIGHVSRYFVPPYNSSNIHIEKICKSIGLTVVKNRVNILNISK